MSKTATARRRAMQRQNQAESGNLSFPFLLLTPLTLSYLCLSYPQYLYLLAPVRKSLCCYENCGRFFAQKKESIRGVECSLQSPAMGVAGYTPNLHHPGVWGRHGSLPRQYSLLYVGSKRAVAWTVREHGYDGDGK